MTRASIRVRLTLWYGGVLMLTLVGLGSAVYLLMARSSLDRVDALLDFEFREAAERLASGRPPAELAEEPSAFHETFFLRIRDARGTLLAQSRSLEGQMLPPTGGDASVRRHATATLGPLGSCRVIAGGVATEAGPLVLQIATALEARAAELAALRRVLGTILPVGLVAATLGGYWLASSSLAPIGRMAEAARRITAANLGERLAVIRPDDELGRLALTLNAMLDRIDRGFAAARRFTADAAHELKTPVAAIRAEAEVALLAPRSVEEYERTLASVVEEAARLARLADRLLALAREDDGGGETRRPLPLGPVVGAAADRAAEPARRAGLELRVEALPDAVVDGDGDALRQVFDNLLENAVKFTPPGGRVVVRGRRDGGLAVVEVIDTGAGIAAADLPRVFDRFFRTDPSRSRRTGGAGLGLSIARAVVERHGGVIAARSEPGRGSTFRVELPATAGAH